MVVVKVVGDFLLIVETFVFFFIKLHWIFDDVNC